MLKSAVKFFAAACAACLSASLAGAEYYVDGSHAAASDASGSGTADKPFKTVEYAATVVTNPGDVIRVAAGTYDFASAVNLTKDISIIGAGPDVTTFRESSKLTVNSAGAMVASVKITKKSSDNNSVLVLKAGTVSNVFVTAANASSTLHNTALNMQGGLLVDSKFLSNTIPSPGNGNNGYGVIGISGNSVVRNCLFASNASAVGQTYQYGGAGAVWVNPGSGKTVTFENCTFAGNRGTYAGAVLICGASRSNGILANTSGSVNLTRCVISGNNSIWDIRELDSRASRTFSYYGTSVTVSLTDCLLEEIPVAAESSNKVSFSGCVFARAGYADERNGDWSLVAGSRAFGWGFNPGERGTGFSCAVLSQVQDRANGQLAATLEAQLFNAPAGDAVYEWDLDGDGVYETSGSHTVQHVFTTPGWNKVSLAVAAGGEVAEYTATNYVYVAPSVIEVSKSGSQTFPYASAATAARTVADALKAVLPGGRIHIAAGEYTESSLQRIVDVEVYGDDDNVGATTIRRAGNGNDAYANVFTTLPGAFVHGLTLGPARASVLSMMEGSVVSNCHVKSGKGSTHAGVGATLRAGLLTHCLLYGNISDSGSGAAVYAMGTSVVRNCVIKGNTCYNGAVLASESATVENCTIYGNTAGLASSICAGVYVSEGKPVIRNNIIWGNTAVGTSGTAT